MIEKANGLGRDLLVAAVIVSALVHIGVMVWARPRVMTQMAAQVVSMTRTSSMEMRAKAPESEMVKIDLVEDVDAAKAAPEAAETAAAVSALDATVPQAQAMEAEKVLPAVSAPEIVSRLKAAESEFRVPQVVDAPASEVKAPMPSEVMMPAVQMAIPSESLPMKDAMGAVQFEAPKVAEVQTIGLSKSSELEASMPVMVEEEGTGEVFTPVAEVMAEVDEKMVEREKAAVKDLIDSVQAADMAEAVTVTLDASEEGNHTYFRATVRPKERVRVVPKDVVVLIDASGSIGRERLTSCRKAARRILRSCTNTGDRFNLVAFRDRFSYAFKTWQECNVASFAAGDKWLEGLAAHGRTDVFSTIASVLTLPRDPARPLIALVVTDGDANVGVRETAQILSKFSALNDGLISVYMYGVKSNANRELIDVLTHGNRGESFIFGGWFRSQSGDKLDALSERFRDPVMSDLRIIFSTTCKAEAYPALLKNLYRGNSVEIVGRVPKGTKEVSFSLKGLSGTLAYEGYFKLPITGAARDEKLPVLWRQERSIDALLK